MHLFVESNFPHKRFLVVVIIKFDLSFRFALEGVQSAQIAAHN